MIINNVMDKGQRIYLYYVYGRICNACMFPAHILLLWCISRYTPHIILLYNIYSVRFVKYVQYLHTFKIEFLYVK